MGTPVEARWIEGDRFELAVRGHSVVVDQPVEDGGEDLGPNPTELFVAALAGCVGFYARRYLDRHGLAAEGLTVRTEFAMASAPVRIGSIALAIEVPAGIPAEHLDRMLAMASRCTVHNTLTHEPEVRIELAQTLVS